MNSITINFDDNADINSAYIHLKKLYPKSKIIKNNRYFDDEYEDDYLISLAAERKKNDNGIKWSFEEILSERGLTVEDIDRMLEEEDVELEYELPD
ncbi:MAG: hypothetical protein FWH10_00915 [Oscillospiraceae bacterium]|nr:hypothetical protein [Oscillospiraceae bacterium]